MLSNDMEALAHSQADGEKSLLLGAHDPYLDIKDRDVLLEDRTCRKPSGRRSEIRGNSEGRPDSRNLENKDALGIS